VVWVSTVIYAFFPKIPKVIQHPNLMHAQKYLGRSWKYDSNVSEYFVEDECKSLLKRSELLREREETELDVCNPVV